MSNIVLSGSVRMMMSKRTRQYLCLLSRAFGGGDLNGILYLMPQAWIWTIFAFILLFNIWILIKKVNPTYTAAFKER